MEVELEEKVALVDKEKEIPVDVGYGFDLQFRPAECPTDLVGGRDVSVLEGGFEVLHSGDKVPLLSAAVLLGLLGSQRLVVLAVVPRVRTGLGAIILVPLIWSAVLVALIRAVMLGRLVVVESLGSGLAGTLIVALKGLSLALVGLAVLRWPVVKSLPGRALGKILALTLRSLTKRGSLGRHRNRLRSVVAEGALVAIPACPLQEKSAYGSS